MAKASLHAEHISPQIVFPAEMPAAWEVIDFLVLIDVFEFTRLDKARPEDVPSGAGYQPEAGGLERVDDAVIGVSRAVYFEPKERVGLQIVLGESL